MLAAAGNSKRRLHRRDFLSLKPERPTYCCSSRRLHLAALICGSLAFDSIATFSGSLRRPDLAEPVAHPQRLVSRADDAARVRRLRRQHRLQPGRARRHAPVVLASGRQRRRRLRRPPGRRGARRPSTCASIEGSYTAQAFIMTDADNNQITAFHPGAMQAAHETPVPSRRRPSPRHHRARRSRRDAAACGPACLGRHSLSSSTRARGCRCSTARSCGAFVDRAAWVALNDYEAQMLERAHRPVDLEAMSRSQLRGIVVTLGAQGCEDLGTGSSKTVIAGETVDGGRRPHRLRRRLSRRAAVRARTRLVAAAKLHGAGQPAGRAQDRQPWRPESRDRSHARGLPRSRPASGRLKIRRK